MPETEPDEPLGDELARFAPRDATDLAALAARIASIKEDAADPAAAFDIEGVWQEVEAHLDGAAGTGDEAR